MGKKVLILSGSPRRGGNSDLLCDEFMKGAIESGNNVEKIFVGDMKIGYCMACDYCKKNNGECVVKDDMAGIVDKMQEADVIVMSSPVYFYSIDAQMKTLIDRMYARSTDIINKDFYFIMTSADTSENAMNGTLGCFRGFAICLNNAKEKGVICARGVAAAGDVKNSVYMQEAFEMGKNV